MVAGSFMLYVDLCAPVTLQADSGFFSEGYSSDEDTVTKEEFKGIIIKQGCLVKQVRPAVSAGSHAVLGAVRQKL